MKSTKKSLIMSMISLILCFAMLLGSTYAWFTDEVTSGTNKIVAGNLDIEVSYKNGSTWTSIEGVDSLFTNNLWEPGHTEYVTLKIENKGSLALKYQMNVSPVSESGGINMAGNTFKLSDYMLFGTTAATATEQTYTDRAAARAAIASNNYHPLTQANLTSMAQGGTLYPTSQKSATQPDEQYITLVVYMPETVGNEANYKTGTTAPTIDLGIKVVATQVENESDSFNNEYDKDIAYPAIDTVITYNYFPQVSYVAQLRQSGNKAVKDGEDANVSESDNKITITSIDKSGENAFVKATFGNDAIATYDGNGKAAVKLDAKKTTEGNFTVGGTDMESVTYDISVMATTGELKDNALFTVELFVGAGKQSITMKHGNANMTKDTGTTTPTVADHFIYNPDTGYIVMAVNHFSEFTAQYNAPVAAVGTTAYYSLKEAAEKAEGKTIFVVRDTEEKNLDLSDVSLDLNGKEVKVTGDNVKLPEGMKQDEEGKIVACTHEGTPEQYTMTEAGHSWKCECGETFTEAHDTLGEGGTCSVCGYKSDAALLAENPNYTCRIGNQGYVYVLGQGAYNTPETKASAIDNAKDGDVIKLIADYKANSYWAKNFTNGETVTIDLNGKTIELIGKSFELQSGNYNIIDSSENGNGKIKNLSLATTQSSYAITVNVYGGDFDKISICQGKGTPKDVNIYGGSVTMLENQGTDGVGYINIYGGHVGYLAIDSDYLTKYHPYTLETGYELGEEITGNEKTTLGAPVYTKLYPVVKK